MAKFVSIMGSVLGHRKLREMTVAEVADRLDQDGFFVVDNNPSRRWTKAHVPGARNLDPADYTSSDLPADKNATLVFYCSGPGCGACHFAARRALQMGYPNVFIMPAGITGWQAAGLPVEQG